MITLSYLYSKILKKIRGKAIKNSKYDKYVSIASGSHVVNSVIKNNSYIGYDCKIYNCRIGTFCSIADHVCIGLSEHNINFVSTSPAFCKGKNGSIHKYASFNMPKSKLTSIGNDVWIGTNVIIKSGVSIGNGAVIGMGSIVTHSVEPYSIVGGNPAKVIRKRFSDDIIKKLQQINWYEFSEQDLKLYAKYINNVEQFISNIERKN